MLRLPRSIRVFAATRSSDFRKDVDGLVRVVREDFGKDPCSGDLFCFFNFDRDRVKLLVWDRNGFWILSKRLERGRFEALDKRARVIEIEREELVMMLAGIDTKTARFRRQFVRDVRMRSRVDTDARSARVAE